MTRSPPRSLVDPEELVRALSAILPAGRITEVRAIKATDDPRGRFTTVWSGYFENWTTLAAALGQIRCAQAIYFIPNPINPALLARSVNRLRPCKDDPTTSDADVLKREFLLIDCDPVRPAGVSAADDEHAQALALVETIVSDLADIGWPEPFSGDSGNGGHAMYPIDLPADDDGLVQRVLEALSEKYSTATVKVDTSVHNVARAWKLYGTMAGKGDDAGIQCGRPHRMAKLLSIPADRQVVPVDLLEQLAGAKPPKTTPAAHTGVNGHVNGNGHLSGKAFDVGEWLRSHNVPVGEARTWTGRGGVGTRWVFDTCPWNSAHADGSAWVIRHASGAADAGCHHNGCKGRGWYDLRELYEPGWRAARDQKQQTKASTAKPQPIPKANVSTPGSNGPGDRGPSSLEVTERFKKQVMAYLPFPIHCLPGIVGQYVQAVADALPCDPAFVALPMLAALGAAIGNTRRLQLKRSWSEPPVIWSVAIGDSGSMKSPAFEMGVSSVRRRQRELMHEHSRELAQYLEAFKTWKETPKEERGEQPVPPFALERVICDDITAEALADRLQGSPRGMLVAVDELAGWFGSFDQYRSKGKGGDVNRWLSMHRAGPLIVDRKTGDVKHIFVPNAAVSVTGTIQPGTLRRCLTPEFFDSGLTARLLLAYPPRRQKVWSEVEVDPFVETGLRAAFDWLYQLNAEQCSDGSLQPTAVPLSSDARSLWAAYVNDQGLEQFGRSDDALIAANAKLEAYAARFALIVHQLRHAEGEVGIEPFRADAQSITSGIELAAWFSREAERVYALLGEERGEKLAREVIELARANGGRLTARLLMQRKRAAFSTAEAARGLLKTLADAGLGTLQWNTPSEGGRPSEVFVLNADADVEDLEERLAVQQFGGG